MSSNIELNRGIVKPGADLAALAETIRHQHEAVILAASDALWHAMAAGDALLVAKDKLGHGFWRQWLHRQCEIAERTAQRYMQLATARALIAANASRATDLTIAGALRLLGNKKLPNRKHGKRPQTLLSSLAWTESTMEERRHFLEAIGLTSLLEAMPASWRSQFAKRARSTPFAMNATDKLHTALRCAEQQKPDEEGFRHMAAALGCIVKSAERNGITRSDIIIAEGKAKRKTN